MSQATDVDACPLDGVVRCRDGPGGTGAEPGGGELQADGARGGGVRADAAAARAGQTD